MEREPKFTTIATCSSVVEAELIEARLEAAGVQSFVRDRHSWPILAGGAGDIRVDVFTADAEVASAIAWEEPDDPDLEVYRVRVDSRALGSVLGLVLAFAAVAPFGPLPPGGLTTAAAIVLLLAGAGVGFALGRRRVRDSCSGRTCGALIPQNAEACPGCGGRPQGVLSPREDARRRRRLSELEDAEEEQEWTGNDEPDQPIRPIPTVERPTLAESVSFVEKD